MLTKGQAGQVFLKTFPIFCIAGVCQAVGQLEGAVRHISAGAQEKSNEPGAAKPFQDAAYRALIVSSANHLDSQGGKLQLVPGMPVNAEIHLGTRSVIEYLLSPEQKVAHEAGRER